MKKLVADTELDDKNFFQDNVLQDRHQTLIPTTTHQGQNGKHSFRNNSTGKINCVKYLIV